MLVVVLTRSAGSRVTSVLERLSELTMGRLSMACGVVDPAGRVVYRNAPARARIERLGGVMPRQLSEGFEIVRLDGRPYPRQEWPVVRSISSAPVYGKDGRSPPGCPS
jgi:hypothetical protein